MNEPLQLNPAPPEVEAVLLWAESYRAGHVEPIDSTEYGNAADIINSLNRYLIEIEIAERRAAMEAVMRQLGEGLIERAERFVAVWSEAMRPVFEGARKWADELIAQQQKRAVELLDSLRPHFDEYDRKKEIQAQRRAAFTVAARRFEPAHSWRRQQVQLRSQARVYVRPMTRTGVRQIIRR